MSEEVAAANGLVEELAAAQATIAGQRRALAMAGANSGALHIALDMAAPHVCSMLCPSVKKTGQEWTHSETCEQITKALTMDQPGAELLAELEQLRAVITRQVEQSATDHQALTEVRGALAVALAELDRTRPHVFGLAKQLGRCDYAFQIILQSTNAPACHETARRMRAELAPKEPNQ